MPTDMGSAELKLVAAAIRRQATFSAHTLMVDHLKVIEDAVYSLISPTTGVSKDRETKDNPEGYVTSGLNPASARLDLKESLRKLGYAPGPDERGTIKDLSSDQRINLVVKTNVELAQGAGHFIQGQDPDVLEAFPAQELVRFVDHGVKNRNWPGRWQQAAAYCGDSDAARVLTSYGRMVARKDSPIWDALGSGGLFDDALDNPFPPFAFNSGMWVQDVDFETAETMGLATLDNIPKPQSLDLADLFNET